MAFFIGIKKGCCFCRGQHPVNFEICGKVIIAKEVIFINFFLRSIIWKKLIVRKLVVGF